MMFYLLGKQDGPQSHLVDISERTQDIVLECHVKERMINHDILTSLERGKSKFGFTVANFMDRNYKTEELADESQYIS